MYVAVKGGQKAIEAAHKALAKQRRGDVRNPEISLVQIRQQLSLAVARVQAEGSLYDQELGALAIKQAQGDLVEASFLLRAARATLARFGFSEPLKTAASRPIRRVSSTFKDLPGGQILGPTFDYTHRLLDRSLMTKADGGTRPSDQAETAASDKTSFFGSESSPVSFSPKARETGEEQNFPGDPVPIDEDNDPALPPGAADYLLKLGLLEAENPEANLGTPPFDLTRQPLEFPQARAGRLQALARADEGFLLALAYSTQRGYGSVHPFVADLRLGPVEVEFSLPETGTVTTIGQIEMTECQTVNQFKGGGDLPPMFTRGYGLCLGHNERKALSMAIVDRALRSVELGETVKGPAQDEEFVLSHADNVEASGFVSHIKLPHYVDFQAELAMLRHMRGELDVEHEPSPESMAQPDARDEAGGPDGLTGPSPDK
jgi:alpha-D-ribose 1-methylphosphonate 5-triphosphate synthase subunit PhnI